MKIRNSNIESRNEEKARNPNIEIRNVDERSILMIQNPIASLVSDFEFRASNFIPL